VFWFSRTGDLLRHVAIDTAHLPPMDAGVTPALVSIFPDQQEPLLYLLIYAYRAARDPGQASASVQGSVTARVYRLDPRTGAYGASVQLPQNPPRKEKIGLKTTEIPSPPSDLLGVSTAGYFSLLAYADTNLYTLQILDPAGRVRAQRYMVIEDSELTFRDLRLSSNGIVYGLLADQTRAHVSWWRSDLLLKGE
jgi:hypothetical protein